LPYDVRKRNCKQADGKKGKYVVVKKKSKGRTEQESCHTSEKKAKGAVRARYASEANEGETVKITLEELKQLISEAMSEVTRPLPVYEEDAEVLTTYEEGEEELDESGASDDPMTEISDEEREEIVATLQKSKENTQAVEDALGIAESSKRLDTLTEAVMVALQPMIKPVHQEMTQDDFWMNVAGIKAESLNEGEVIDMFSDAEKKQNAVNRIAHALALRAEAMLDDKAARVESALDLDGSSNFIDVEIDVDVDPAMIELFLSPYQDLHGRQVVEVPSLAEMIYKDYISGKAGDQAESLDSIIERISIDYFDEDIEYALEALGDDRFTMPHTYYDDDQMMKTKEMASRQDPDDIGDMELAFDKFLDDKEEEMEAVRSSDNVIPLRPEED